MTAVICACGANFYLNDGDTYSCSNCLSTIRREGQVLTLIRWEQNAPATAILKTTQPGSSAVDFSHEDGDPVHKTPARRFVEAINAEAAVKVEEYLDEQIQAPWAQKARE